MYLVIWITFAVFENEIARLMSSVRVFDAIAVAKPLTCLLGPRLWPLYMYIIVIIHSTQQTIYIYQSSIRSDFSENRIPVMWEQVFMFFMTFDPAQTTIFIFIFFHFHLHTHSRHSSLLENGLYKRGQLRKSWMSCRFFVSPST